MDETPVYLLAQLDVKDHEEYMRRYGMPAIAVLQKYGAEVLVASATPNVLEGARAWTVVLRFPNRASAEAFYRAPEYQPLKALREGELTRGGSVHDVPLSGGPSSCDATAAPGVPPASTAVSHCGVIAS
jgi:uncharacterized protein (DUF1330 family)